MAGSSPTVNDKGKKGPEVAAHPDTSPYPSVPGSSTSQFEAVSPAGVAGGKKAGMSQHAGAPDGSGPGPSFKAQKGLRGHKPIDFMAPSGNSPTRGPGTKTPTDRATREKLATAESG